MAEPEENAIVSTEVSQFASKENEIVDIEDDKEEENKEDKNKEDTGNKEGRKQMVPRSEVWLHFSKNLSDKNILLSGTCKYCNRNIMARSKKNGTSAMLRHLTTCKHNPNRNAKDPSQSTLEMTVGGPGISKFDPEELREAFATMVIEDEQPFSRGERPGFRKFMAKACPRFTMPSRRTCTRGAVRKYFEEKAKLKQFFKKHGERVCLTTDCWTSRKQDGYMDVTAHFIDDEWQLHKKIISFFKVKGHKGEDIGKNLQRVMNEWGMQKVITVTVDNASSNDGGLSYLRKQMVNAKTCIANGKYLHMRCAAHIVNLIVTDGLKEVDLSVQRVRAAVRFIRNGTTRLDKFKEIVDEEKIESDAFLNLDICTRWNSTYLMLKAALVYEKVFLRLGDEDATYVVDLAANGGVGHPDEDDWHKVRNIAEFLKHFHDLTVRLSSSLHVTANSFFMEIGEVHILVKKWLDSEDDLQKEMGKRMKEKYNKYWGLWHENTKQHEQEKDKGKGKEKEKENINLLIFVAAVVDPRYKLSEDLELVIDEIFGEENGHKVWVAVNKCLRELFEEYMKLYAPPSDATPQTSNSQENKDGASVGGGMMKELIAKKRKLSNNGSSRISNHKSELDKYLAEDCEDPDKKLDVLTWWKLNATRYPIIAHLACDVLAIPISTVASESAFSTGGRVLDDFRTSLTPFMVESLVCTQDWLRRSTPINVEENYEELAELEKELIDEYANGKGKCTKKGKEKEKTSQQASTSKSSMSIRTNHPRKSQTTSTKTT